MQVVDKLDFSSWDVLAGDMASELARHPALRGGKLGTDGSGLAILLCSIAEQSLETVGADDSVTEEQRMQRAQSGLSR